VIVFMDTSSEEATIEGGEMLAWIPTTLEGPNVDSPPPPLTLDVDLSSCYHNACISKSVTT